MLEPAPTRLTLLTQFSALVLTLIILLPVRPSRENVISIPTLRRNVCARRSRPASARGFKVAERLAAPAKYRAQARGAGLVLIKGMDKLSAIVNDPDSSRYAQVVEAGVPARLVAQFATQSVLKKSPWREDAYRLPGIASRICCAVRLSGIFGSSLSAAARLF